MMFFVFLAIFTAFSLFFARLTLADFHRPIYGQNANLHPARRVNPLVHQLIPRAPSQHTYTSITPSPGADPVMITTQYQLVTSYVPQYTLCPLSAVPNAPGFNSLGRPGSNNATAMQMRVKYKRAHSRTHSAALDFPNAPLPHSPNGDHLRAGGPNAAFTVPPPFANVTGSRLDTATPSPPLPAFGNTSAARLGTALPSPPPSPPWANASSAARLGSDPATPATSALGLFNTTTTASLARLGTAIPPTPRSPLVTPPPCHTTYAPTVTPICHTTLTALASRETITDCAQRLTVSTQYGYTLVLPPSVSDAATLPTTAQPSIQTITTYWIADWTDLTAGSPTSLTEKVCSRAPGAGAGAGAGAEAGAGEECIDTRFGLQTRMVTTVTTTTRTIDISTTVPGPSRVLVETWDATVSETATLLEMQTRVVAEVSTEGVVLERVGAMTRVGDALDGVDVTRTISGTHTRTQTVTATATATEAGG